MGRLGYVITALNVAGSALKMVPAIGDNLEAVAELAKKICEQAETIGKNREAYEQLAERVGLLIMVITETVEHAALNGSAGSLTLEDLWIRVAHLTQLLEEIKTSMDTRITPAPSAKQPHASKLRPLKELFRKSRNTLAYVSVDGDVAKWQRQVDEEIDRFKVAALIRVELTVHAIQKRLEEDGFSKKLAMSQKLEVLQPVTSARWDMLADKDFCMENTRTDLLATLESWARSSSGPPVLWLSGLAGTGKSTIARTLCQRLGDGGSDVLGASFFVSRDVQERRSPAHIVRSIVYQLAKKDHTFAKEVHQALDADRDLQVVGSYALHNQISSLLVQPAQAIAADRSFVIVIDALDECVEDAKGRPGGDLLLLIARGLIPLSGRLKLFITSRAESAIQRMFAKLSSDSRQTVLLHDLDTNVVQGDIRTYLQRSFQDIAAERKDSLDLEGWPSTEDFERLVLLCGVLFVVAATVIRFVDHPKHSPRLRLAPVLMSGEGGPELSPYRRLDDLYTQVLGDAVKTEEEDSEELCRRIRVVVGAIVTVLRPLPVDGLAILLSTELHGDGIHADDVQLAVESLSSLLLFKKRGPVKVFHPSFPDFVQDPKRCRDARFFVASSEYHGRLAHSCLAILNRCLRYNICEIPHPGMKNADIVNLQERLDDAIRSSPFAKGLGKQLVQALPEIIYYASRSWAFHLARASRNPVDQLLLIELNNFCRNHTFHWLEFVSLEESRVSAGRSLPAAIEWCRSHEISNQTALVGILLQDTLNVLQVYHEAVRTHALHVYNSAGATMANAALIEYLPRQRREGASIPRLLSPRQDVSGPWRISDEGESDWVLSVAFSPDSARMAFGMKHGPVYIKDASNLELMATLSGHESAVRSVAFSSDGKHIVSGSEDGTVRVWDASFFQQQVLLNTHDGKVCCVAFSPDSTHIIAGTSTGTVRIWDTETLVQLASRRLASTPLYAISYSPEGARIVVAATDNNPRVYDACTFDELGSLKGHEAPVLTVAYSYDGTRVASGSVDETVRVWDAATFDLLATIDGHTDWIHSVAFSPDGTRIVSGSEDSDVQVWELQDDNQPRQLTKIKAHACPVRSVAFSPDGNRFASAGNDCAVRCWDANHYNYAELAGHENWVHSLAFSPDGTRVVSAAADHTICVWDAMEFAEIVQLDSPPLDVESIGFLTDNNAVCVRYHPGKQITWTCQTSAEGVWVPMVGPSPHEAAVSANAPQYPVFEYRYPNWLTVCMAPGADPVDVLWMTADRRGKTLASSGAKVAIGGYRGTVTIVDFADVLAELAAGMHARM